MDNFSALLGKKLAGSGGGSGTSNYNELENKPQINGNTLIGNKTAANLGLQSAINQNNKLDADLIDDSESEKKLVSENDISNWNNKYGSDDAYTKAQTDAVIENAINVLDVAETGGAGKYISAISETNGKINATPTTFDTALLSSSTNNNAPTTKAVYDDQQRQEVEIGAVANRGAKNLLEITATTQTINGVTFTVNADQTITMNGTSQNRAQFLLRPNTVYAGMQGCILSGAVQNNQDIALIFQRGASPWTVYASDSGSGAVIQDYNDNSLILVYINVPAGVTVYNLVFKPMIRHASITDSTFVPYAKTNRELTVAEDEDRAALIEQIDSGAKNLFDYDVLGQSPSNIGNSVVMNGVRFTMNSDKSVTITRESSSSQDAYVWFRSSDGSGVQVTDFCDDAHIFSGAAGGSVSTYILFINNINGSGTFKYFGEGKIIGAPRATPNAAGISIAAGYSPSNLVIKPMICTAADYAVSPKFVPYRPSWQEMWEMIQALQSGGASTQSVQPTLMSAAKPMIDTEEVSEKEAEPDEVSEIEEKEGAEER